MPRSRELPEEVRKQVVEAYQSGKGYKLISKAMGLSKTTIRAILRKWKRFGTVMNLPRSGRPPKISPKTRREIIREVMKNPCTTSKDVQAALAAANISVHDSTIRRLLGVHGRPTLSGLQDVMSLGCSSDKEEGTHEAFESLSDVSGEFPKTIKVEKDQHDLDELGCVKDGRGEAVEDGHCEETLEQESDDCPDFEAGDATEKCIEDDDDDDGGDDDDADADSDSSEDMVYKYDDDDDDDDHGLRYDNGCDGGCDDDSDSCDETEGDSTVQ